MKQKNTAEINNTVVNRRDLATHWQLMWWQFKKTKWRL